MITSLILFFVGLSLSAFFSGSETGLYRVSRTRLVLDGLSGSRAARGMIWLLNNPAIFVATTLVGNNIANYITSFAVVLGVGTAFGSAASSEMIGTALMTPIVFVFGELLPKYLFYHAPYQLITAIRPLLLVATVLSLPVPISLVLGLLGRLLQRITGQTPFHCDWPWHAANWIKSSAKDMKPGILAAGQRSLAQQLFEVGNQSGDLVRRAGKSTSRGRCPGRCRTGAASSATSQPSRSCWSGAADELGFVWYADLCVRHPPVELMPTIRGECPTDTCRFCSALRCRQRGSCVARRRRRSPQCRDPPPTGPTIDQVSSGQSAVT